MHVDPLTEKILALTRADSLPEGAHLSAQKLADRLGVSRSPVNEALARLHENGALLHEKNRGYFLARQDCKPNRMHGLPQPLVDISEESRWEYSALLATPDSLLQFSRVRSAIEIAALLEPGYALARSDIDVLRMKEERRLAGRVDASTHLCGVMFHQTLVEASGNPFLIDTYRRISRLRRILAHLATPDIARNQTLARQHLRILDLLERGQNLDASDELRQHLSKATAPGVHSP